MFDYAIVGGGIVGLATGMTLCRRNPGCRLLLLEKEAGIARHQSGHNSGVIHSGIYYKPGSFKAAFAREGSRTMVEFCREHGVPHNVSGKLIVATNSAEMPLLENLLQRGLQNGLSVTRLTADHAGEVEPHVRCLAAIKVPTTGVVDYKEVCSKYAELIQENGGLITTSANVLRIRHQDGTHHIETTRGNFESRFLITCAGLHSDRVARLAGLTPDARIVPFRGEYYELVPEKAYLVKTLIYPVPNPEFPFLGVHFTRGVDGSVHCGPNAVLAYKREGYTKTDFNIRDFVETMSYGGFWKMARKNFREGFKEIYRSFNKAAFVRSLQTMIPEVQADDLVPTTAGVRAQALAPDGRLVDDFWFLRGENSLHVCNAPSPAATASLEIAKEIARQVPEFSRSSISVSVA